MSNRTRTGRAKLTAGAVALRQSSRIAATAIATPILISGLGKSDYGSWLVIHQAVGFAALADLRASSTLKFSLALTQDNNDPEGWRRQIGSAVYFWLRTLPLLALSGAVLLVLVPRQLDGYDVDTTVVRWTCLIVFATAVLDRILSLAAHVLRGMNMDYLSTRLEAITLTIPILGGAFAAALGYGLIGVAGAAFAGMLITNLGRWMVARRALPWLGLARPAAGEIRSFSAMSGWLIVGDVASLITFGAELLVVGAVAGPTAAAIYATTQFVVRASVPTLIELMSSGGPGVAQLASRKEWAAVAAIRNQTFALACGLLAVIATGVVLANEAFVAVWTEQELFGGQSLNLLLVVAGACTALVRLDAVFVDVVLNFKRRAVWMLGLGLATLPFMVWAGDRWGAVGVAASALGGRVALLAATPRLVADATRQRTASVVRSSIRPLAFLTGVVCTAALVATGRPTAMLSALAVSAVAIMIVLPTFWLLGLTGTQRQAFTDRVRAS